MRPTCETSARTFYFSGIESSILRLQSLICLFHKIARHENEAGAVCWPLQSIASDDSTLFVRESFGSGMTCRGFYGYKTAPGVLDWTCS